MYSRKWGSYLETNVCIIRGHSLLCSENQWFENMGGTVAVRRVAHKTFKLNKILDYPRGVESRLESFCVKLTHVFRRWRSYLYIRAHRHIHILNR